MNLKIRKIEFKKLFAFIIFFSVSLTYGQSMKKMKGKVIDTKGNPILGVTIFLIGDKDNNGATSELDGSYVISSNKPYKTVEFSYMGMKTKNLPFKNGDFDVVMEESEESLDEVIITGYQKVNISETVGVVDKVDMKGFQSRIAGSGGNIITTLEGLSPSLVATSDPNSPGSKRMLVRGVSTLEGDGSPLIVLDGFPFEGGIEDINSYDIETITLLKDAASASIYGARSANGVLVITTKRGKGDGSLQVVYNTNWEVSEKDDLEYTLNRASSSDYIDEQIKFIAGRGSRIKSAQYYYEKGQSSVRSKPKVLSLLLENKEGRLSDEDLKEQLDYYRGIDNTKDFEKLFFQLPLYKEHNLSVDYATKKVKLRSSLNYNTTDSSVRDKNSQGFRYSATSFIKVSNRMTLDLMANININNSFAPRNSVGQIYSLSSYERFYDDNGNPLAITKPSLGSTGRTLVGGKQLFEINRLIGLGLFDESYKPAEDYQLGGNTQNSWNSKFQAQLSLNLTKSLTGNFAFNVRKGANTSRELISERSWEMKSTFNHLTKKTDDGLKGEILLPLGDRLIENRGDNFSYLLRGQLDYDKKFNSDNKLRVLFGTEIKANRLTSTTTDRLGYNSASNLFVQNINHKDLLEGVEKVFHPDGYVNGVGFSDGFSDRENRYFAVFGNTSYTFKNRYVLHGSARIDQSNLFGTDPEHRYKPFWSTGFKWRLGEEEFFKNKTFSKLDLQVSYGFTGNISNRVGPFDMASYRNERLAFNKLGLKIYSPAVQDLRWEKKRSLNIGLQTSMLHERLSLTLNYYREEALDILAISKLNPTLGFGSVTRNDSSISNNGLEVSLTTVNVRKENFMWNTYLGVNFNKSKVTNVFLDPDDYENSAYRIARNVNNLEGYAPNSLFVFDSSVTEEGGLAIKKADGTIVLEKDIQDPNAFKIEDLEHAGSIVPNFVGRLTNNISYKDFGLSFMFIYQGGHVLLRDTYNGELITGFSMHKDVANAWKNPGDEKKDNVRPAVGSMYYNSFARNSKDNIISGDYLRLRDIVLTYSLPQSFIAANKYVKECTFNLKAKNTFLWTKNKEGIDPESHGLGRRSAPVRKSISLGINVTF